jgi:hypothetical protein
MVRACGDPRPGRRPFALLKASVAGADAVGVMDEFHFGKPGRRGPQVRIDPRLFLVVGGLLAVVALVVVFMNFVSKSGHEVADSQATVIQQVDHTRDIQAKQNVQNALLAVKEYFTENSSYQGLTPASLAAVEPSLQYTDGPSPSVTTVSVAATADTVALAIEAPSGTCFYAKDTATAGTTFGSGTICTGQAALTGATAASW